MVTHVCWEGGGKSIHGQHYPRDSDKTGLCGLVLLCGRRYGIIIKINYFHFAQKSLSSNG